MGAFMNELEKDFGTVREPEDAVVGAMASACVTRVPGTFYVWAGTRTGRPPRGRGVTSMSTSRESKGTASAQ